MSKLMQTDKVMRGNYGKVWVNTEEFSNVTEFEASLKGEWKPVSQVGVMGEGRRYMGFVGEGKLKMNKIDSSMVKLLAKGYKTGNMPDVKIVSKLDDPTAYGAERVSFSGVTFDELQLMKFVNKELGEEEINFKYQDFELLETVS